MSHHIYLYF